MAGNIHDEQPGLEVIQEPEAPQVVEGPTYPKHQWDQPTPTSGSPYQQTHTPVHNGYGQYPPPAASYPPSHGPWGSSQTGTGTIMEKPPAPTVCGIKRRTFWFIVGPLLAVFIIGLAVGLGVGLGTNHSSSSTATPTSSASSSSTSTTSSATATPTVTSIQCPSSNNTIYNDATNNAKFVVLCNLDYNSGGGSQDIGNVVTSSIEECADACAANGSCAGAGWGNYYGTTYCWLKSQLGTSQSASNWFFVVKQT